MGRIRAAMDGAAEAASEQYLVIPLQASLTGADFSFDSNDPVEALFAVAMYFFTSAAALVAIAVLVLVLLPATRHWCAGPGRHGSARR